MDSDAYKKLPPLSRLWLRAHCAWTIFSPGQIALALAIASALPLAPNAVAVSLLWSMDIFERHAVKIGSPEEALTRAYLSHLGRTPLSRYDKVAAAAKKSGLSHAFPRADEALDWLKGGPVGPSPHQGMTMPLLQLETASGLRVVPHQPQA